MTHFLTYHHIFECSFRIFKSTNPVLQLIRKLQKLNLWKLPGDYITDKWSQFNLLTVHKCSNSGMQIILHLSFYHMYTLITGLHFFPLWTFPDQSHWSKQILIFCHQVKFLKVIFLIMAFIKATFMIQHFYLLLCNLFSLSYWTQRFLIFSLPHGHKINQAHEI